MLTHQKIKYTDQVNVYLTTERIMGGHKDTVNQFIKFSFEGKLYRVLTDKFSTLDDWLNGKKGYGVANVSYVRELSEREKEWFFKYEKSKFKK